MAQGQNARLAKIAYDEIVNDPQAIGYKEVDGVTWKSLADIWSLGNTENQTVADPTKYNVLTFLQYVKENVPAQIETAKTFLNQLKANAATDVISEVVYLRMIDFGDNGGVSFSNPLMVDAINKMETDGHLSTAQANYLKNTIGKKDVSRFSIIGIDRPRYVKYAIALNN